MDDLETELANEILPAAKNHVHNEGVPYIDSVGKFGLIMFGNNRRSSETTTSCQSSKY